jgi:hypothetical protein
MLPVGRGCQELVQMSIEGLVANGRTGMRRRERHAEERICA